MPTNCLECENPLKGRSDKKFCDDSCRNSYNNRVRRDVNNEVRNVNRILAKNYRILMDSNPNGKSKTSREKLVSLGFNFNFHTSTYQNKKGDCYYFCYDQGYLLLDQGLVALVKKYQELNPRA